MIYDMNTVLGFGKHKGLTPKSIVQIGDTNYLCWLSFYFKGKSDALAQDVLDVVNREFARNPGLARSLEQKFAKDKSGDASSAITAALAKSADKINAFGQQAQVYAEDFGSF